MKKTIFTLSLILSAYLLKAQVLYGTTSEGGNNNGGAICKLVTATNTLTAQFSFDAPGGYNPGHKLLQASNGKLYGMATHGGNNDYGVIFSFDPVTSAYIQLKNFDFADGIHPYGSLIQASDGKLYGMTSSGGSDDYGVIFSYDPATSTYTKLIDFDSTNGNSPYGSLVQASDGKLYGMTNQGGSHNVGVIFSYDPAALTYTKLIDFDGINGNSPDRSLVQASDGKLYGMTNEGGSNNAGVIFSYNPVTAAFIKLVDFDYTNGAYPYGDLVQASDGKLYGMTNFWGNGGSGVIFSYDPAASTYAKLKSFDDSNGSYPYGSLLQASDGKLYGMTGQGGSNNVGVIFSFMPVTLAYTKLYDFHDTDGNHPDGSLIQASDGKLYGMTPTGGSFFGVIFSYDAVTSIYTKQWDLGGNNTGYYITGALIKDRQNKLYGMTLSGGSHASGVIFSYDATTLAFRKLKDFDGINGDGPFGSLVLASDEKLYGMTAGGGSKDLGVIFSYDPSTFTYTKLKDFDGTNGNNPGSSLIQASDGNLYGMTGYGGSKDLGVIFSYDPSTSTYTKLKDFDGTNGASPQGSLMQASDGKLYGMTLYGGTHKHGVIFSYDPSTSAYIKLKDFDNKSGAYPEGDLVQVSGGKLYGMADGGGNNDYGVIFSYDLSTSIYTKLEDFDSTNGAYPEGSLMQASDGKLYGMTNYGGSNAFGVAFSYNPTDSTYTKLSDFTGDNGSHPRITSFTEIPVLLSVALTNFSGEVNGKQNLLHWTTVTEQNNTGFEIQRSIDGYNFNKIGFTATKAINGNSNLHLSYDYADNAFAQGTNYYRLKQLDKDGKFNYSNIVVLKDVHSLAPGLSMVYPNPANNILNVKLSSQHNDITLLITDLSGKSLLGKTTNIGNGESIVQVDISHLPAGMYFLKIISSDSSENTVMKFVKQ